MFIWFWTRNFGYLGVVCPKKEIPRFPFSPPGIPPLMQRGTFGFPPVSPWLLCILCIRHDLLMSSIPGYDAALNSATLSLGSDTGIKMPWERNKLLGSLLGADNDRQVKRPRMNLASSSNLSSPITASVSDGESRIQREVQKRRFLESGPAQYIYQ